MHDIVGGGKLEQVMASMSLREIFIKWVILELSTAPSVGVCQVVIFGGMRMEQRLKSGSR